MAECLLMASIIVTKIIACDDCMLAIACEKLTAPVNGQIVSDESISRFGSNVTFTCNSGYQLTGSASRTCLTTGAWSGVPAVCKRTSFDRSTLFIYSLRIYVEKQYN